jgi:hypothetical protein
MAAAGHRRTATWKRKIIDDYMHWASIAVVAQKNAARECRGRVVSLQRSSKAD